jgi:hypothetical protein
MNCGVINGNQMFNSELLKKLQKFLNAVPNRKYGDNYLLASELKKVTKLREEVIHTLSGIKEDTKLALDGRWDCTTQEGIETGFTAQIELIDEMLNKLK